MSRIGKKPVPIPDGVTVAVAGRRVLVKGPKGELTQELTGAVEAVVDEKARQVLVRRTAETRADRAKHGLYRALLAAMIVGVTRGYEKALEVHGVGFRAAREGEHLALQLGFADVKKVPVPGGPNGLEVVCPDQQRIIVRGIDKALVGNFAARVRAIRPPDPYKNKGIRYAGEVVRKLAGKTFATGTAGGAGG